MTKHTFAHLDDVLREMDPAPPTLTEDERHRAAATRDRIMATPSEGHVRIEPERKKRHRGRALVAVAIAATAAVAVPTLIGGGSAFASWTATPEPLSRSAATAAASTCRAALGIDDQGAQAVISEMRGNWTYVLLEGPAGEGACMLPDGHANRKDGFFGNYNTDPPEAPTPARDGIDETWNMEGSVTVPGRLGIGSSEEWFSWVNGYVGSDVAGVTVHPPVGPDVEATVSHGRFSAWWPGEPPSSDNPAVGKGWTYTVTLADGTTQRADA